MKPKVIAVVGPTATGKSDLAIELCRTFGGQILSCDSMQVYRGMDIGTAKVTKEQMQGIPHHLIDIADPEESFSCAQYADLAKELLGRLADKGVLPVFCGGTGQYLDAVLTDNEFSSAGVDKELRDSLNMRDVDSLWEELASIDPESAAAIHKNNKKRVIRAIEVYRLTGMTKTEWDKRSRVKESPYDALIIGLYSSDRERLYRRIDERVDVMMEQGLLDEVKGLRLLPGTTAYDAIGYKELCSHIFSGRDLHECVEDIKRASRRYAKRQMTWFGAKEGIVWLDSATLTREEIVSLAVEKVREFLSK